jgi:hypothetical protein
MKSPHRVITPELCAVLEQEFEIVVTEFRAKHPRRDLVPAAIEILGAEQNQKVVHTRFLAWVRHAVGRLISEAIEVAERREGEEARQKARRAAMTLDLGAP